MAHFFTRALLQWHHDNPRPLPWSGESPDPYRIWLSEIIMQQTRIEQGTIYYLRFVESFPTIKSLSEASPDEVMRLWQGLGYYTRARNLHKTAKYIVQHLDGLFPQTYEGLLNLPGIGPYSAAAISSFAFGQRHAVVDGNVKRVIARFSGINQSIDDPSTHDMILKIAMGYMKNSSPGLFNQAIMNFGALVCKPKGALCNSCPLSKKCYAFQNNMVDILPVRSKKKLNRDRYFHFFVFQYRGKFLMQRREGKDIWHGLYTPPLMERKSERSLSVSRIQNFAFELAGHNDFEVVGTSSTIRQLLSHQTLLGKFVYIKLRSAPKGFTKKEEWISKKNIQHYGKPKMIVQMFEEIGL